ncbi:hypothetical protein, partial [Klebsiella pneumoniae]|uniref:hypothetical protein n=1 Tax=Klebsiella pneumoniae TaxID=573 RepID=UPI001C5E402C
SHPPNSMPLPSQSIPFKKKKMKQQQKLGLALLLKTLQWLLWEKPTVLNIAHKMRPKPALLAPSFSSCHSFP